LGSRYQFGLDLVDDVDGVVDAGVGDADHRGAKAQRVGDRR